MYKYNMSDAIQLFGGPANVRARVGLKDATSSIIDDIGINRKVYKMGRMADLISSPGNYFQAKIQELNKAVDSDLIEEDIGKLAKEFKQAGFSDRQAINLSVPVARALVQARISAVELQFPSSSRLTDVDSIIGRLSSGGVPGAPGRVPTNIETERLVAKRGGEDVFGGADD